MNEFLNSVKIDLLDRRLRPYVALVAVALVAALAFAVLGGSSSTSSGTPTAARVNRTPGIATSTLAPNKAVAETTNGGSEQKRGVARNPFTPVVAQPKPASASASASSSATSTASSSSSSASSPSPSSSSKSESGGSGGSTSPSKSSKPSKPKTVYHVSVLFGVLPAGTAPLTATLTEDKDLKLLTPLPDAKTPLLVFRGVTAKGKSATFTVVGEAILHGQGACLPTASQCQAIDLQPGNYEQLEVLTATGEVVTYELRVASIQSEKASAASVKSMLKNQSKEGLEVLRNGGLTEIPFLHSSSQVGVLVFGAARASSARAHVALSRVPSS